MKLRGLFPSLGAGGSLIAAAACALAFLGGVLAFRGESPATAEADSGSVVMPGGTLGVQTSSPRAVESVVALVETVPSPPAQRRAEPRRRSVRRGGPQPTPPRAGTNPSPPAATPGPAAPAAPEPAPKPAPSPAPAPAAPEIVPSGTVKRAVEQTRGAVQPVVDTVPEPVQAPVERVADTVEGVAGTVDETVDGLTGSLLPD